MRWNPTLDVSIVIVGKSYNAVCTVGCMVHQPKTQHEWSKIDQTAEPSVKYKFHYNHRTDHAA